MKVLLTGASGSVGRFLLKRLTADAHEVTILGRHPVVGALAAFHPFDLLSADPRVPAADALVHCALLHAPGRFRGGEGDDPKTFETANVDGTRRVFEAARRAGCRRAVFLSSRAVYGDHRRGELLRETDDVQPDSLYGEVKRAGELALLALSDRSFRSSVLRATGVYGLPPGLKTHKWSSLFEAFTAGDALCPRRATELHGDDLAAAVSLLLAQSATDPFSVYNASDLLLDRRELLALYGQATGAVGQLPRKATDMPGVMATDTLQALGWVPGGMDKLQAFLKNLPE